MKERSNNGLVTLLAIATYALLLTACSSGPDIFINSVPNDNIENFQTYNFDAELGTDPSDGARSALSQYLMKATSRELEKRGYRKSDDPDFLVDFDLTTKEKIRTTSSPTYAGGYGYRGYGGWGAYGGYDTTVTQYTEGTLTVGLIDNTAEQKQFVWEASAEGRMTDKVRENLQEAVDTVVPELFARYPYVAAGFVPPQTTADQ